MLGTAAYESLKYIDPISKKDKGSSSLMGFFKSKTTNNAESKSEPSKSSSKSNSR